MAAAACREDVQERRLYYVMAETGPQVVKDVLESKGWLPYVEGKSLYWNLWWKGSRYRKSDYEACQPWQRLNHFPKTLNLTRKDTLYRLLKTMRGIYGPIYDFVPLTFSLPNDYVRFVRVYAEEDEQGVKGLWICKPADLSRGRGIFLFRDLHELTYDCNVIVQRYISNPMLISGYKFDIRCYVVVRSYNPLVVYLNQEGIARFATSVYTTTELSNVYAHLTNTSINKFSPSLSHEKDEVGSGCRWTLGKLRTWFEGMGVDFEKIWRKIQGIILLTLLPVAVEVPLVPAGCFELYGFDIMLDENLRPHLLEVNFGPALSLDTDVDVEIKKPLIEDIINLVEISDEQARMAVNHALGISGRPATRGSRSQLVALDKKRFTSLPELTRTNSLMKQKARSNRAQRNVGRLRRIMPFNDTTAELVCHPLAVGKPALKQIIQEIRRTLL
ncbi:uncharacterized protein SPPG_01124 [Spizellomyces punctatus DAOM BR117]|uniref:Tubulin-tyrosine ligase n=1 Tax=Spizellomyces punctatus (strain DAOM BR117) TaxID=645134 RepID=A0A0L0HRH0_SPIPD|nr:uncharacterized protein SPPG_01124 [Spizellomyces punctatus DAOM BR117]KND03653.1 hypothetical protein SPPG_01124 [Spizellomyces punctatus DAOM BR117]|eukprot:XP_016611692.1 hypothetical protein SPPG_01124 [Spizellomyces punctatus DAOM BR117]